MKGPLSISVWLVACGAVAIYSSPSAVYSLNINPGHKQVNNSNLTTATDLVSLSRDDADASEPREPGTTDGPLLDQSTPSYLQTGDRFHILKKGWKKARNFVQNLARDIRRRRMLKRALPGITSQTQEKVITGRGMMALRQIIVYRQAFGSSNGKDYLVREIISLNSEFIYLQATDSAMKMKSTVRYPLIWDPPREVTLRETKAEFEQMESERRRLPQAMRRHTVQTRDLIQGNGSPDLKQIAVRAPSVTIPNMAQMLEGLAVCLYDVDPTMLVREVKLYLLAHVLQIARQSVLSKLVFPQVTAKSFWVTNGAQVKLAETEGVRTDESVTAPAAGDATSNREMAWTAARLIHHIWCKAADGEPGAGKKRPPARRTAFVDLSVEDSGSPLGSLPPRGTKANQGSKEQFEIDTFPEVEWLNEEPVGIDTCPDSKVGALLQQLINGPSPSGAIREAYKLFRSM